MTAESIKLNIIKALLPLDNIDVLLRIQSTLGVLGPSGEPDSHEDYPVKMSFEEWNKQFEDDGNVDLDEFLPEYNMTLGQFRKIIWKGEQETPMTLEAFLDDQKSWRR